MNPESKPDLFARMDVRRVAGHRHVLPTSAVPGPLGVAALPAGSHTPIA